MPCGHGLSTLRFGTMTLKCQLETQSYARVPKQMTIRIIINDHEVKNPVARFLLTLFGLILFIVFFALVFFLILPLIWFMVLSLLLMILAVLAVAPKMVKTYRVIILKRRSLPHDR